MAAGGLTGLAYKGYSDLGKGMSKLDNWEQIMRKHTSNLGSTDGMQQRLINKIKSRISDPSAQQAAISRITAKPNYLGEHYVNTGLASNIIDDYSTQAANIARSKVLGVRTGDAMSWLRRKEGPDVSGHYSLFANPKASLDDLRYHMIEKGLGHNPEMHKAFWDNATPQMHALLKQPGSIQHRLTRFEKAFPGSQAFNVLKNSITGTPGTSNVSQIGEAMRLAGNGSTVASTPSVYGAHIRSVLKPFLSVKNPLLAAGTALTAGLAAYPFMRKKADMGNPYDVAGGAVAAGVSPFMLHKGYDMFKNPNKNIGLTWGEMTGDYGVGDVGSGHKAPAQAIKSMLTDEAARPNSPLAGYSFDDIARNKSGLIHAPNKHYNTIIDTGLGNYSDPWAHGTLKTHGHTLPQVATADSRMPMLTDMVPGDKPWRTGATKVPQRPDTSLTMPKSLGELWGKIKSFGGLLQPDHFMGYGPTFEAGARHQGYVDNKAHPWRFSQVSKGLTPAVDKEVMDIIASPKPREQVFQNLAAFFKDTHPELSQQFASGLGGKKHLVTISGSGRGDYVASRARQLAEAMRASGRNDIGIVAQMAGAMNDPKQMALLKDFPEVLPIGRMPRKDFVGLQRASDIHWGSAGTSSLAESMLQDTPLALPKDWGYRHWWGGNGRGAGDHFTENTPASYMKKLMGDAGHNNYNPAHEWAPGNVPVTSWNKGNIQYAHQQPGVLAADNADDIMKLFSNPEAMNSLRQGASTRATDEMTKLTHGRRNLLNTIIGEVQRNNQIQKIKGLGLLGLGGTALGTGAYLLGRGSPAKPTNLLTPDLIFNKN